MGKIAFFDCSAGAAGDMILGSLIDAGASLDAIKAGLQTIEAIRGEWDISTERVWKGKGLIAATKLHVSSIHEHASLPAPYHVLKVMPVEETLKVLPLNDARHTHDDVSHNHSHNHSHDHDDGHHHDHDHSHHHGHESDDVDHDHERNFQTISDMIDKSLLSPWVKEHSKRVFRVLAEAEAAVHGTTMDKVHFHEVGAIDSIVDTIGSVLALELLRVDQVHCSFLPFSKGFIHCMHGVMPVPAPATLRLFMDMPLCPAPKGATGELVTPTGASLMKALAQSFGQPPPFVPTSSGSGAGTKEFPNHANIVRVVVGDACEPSATIANVRWTPMNNNAESTLPSMALPVDSTVENVSVLETNLDDINPQVFGHVQDLLFAHGALDVWLQPIQVVHPVLRDHEPHVVVMQMKKNRPAFLLSVLCHHQNVGELSGIVFCETTTLGIRRQVMDRIVLRRESTTVSSSFGDASVKIGYLNGRVVNVQPEFDDCKVRGSIASGGSPLPATISALALEKVGKAAPSNEP
ncbi:Aste57867_13278 [Aphanomyces stellatus]|uniref:Aste57867_13278 protein n=1 Tax=Aphanomyces stellatus TaxID=120398 RepID=A0A485KZS3_9STRA|nr:hypothetical protein As57867_013229 [Aphanomyces stellatus]VFT90117.1 Aste57867_13278 [Aphanomyces stellatus]